MEFLRYFFVICLFIYCEAKSVHYDYEYDEDAKVWFKLHRIGATWHEARKMCNMEGAIMASPVDKPIKDALEAYSRAYDLDQIFVGIHSTFSGDIWHTIEGVPLETIVDNLDITHVSHDYKHCSTLNAGSLISVACGEVYPYMCYKRENNDGQLTSCGTTDKGYVMYSETGNCYKFHTHEKTWWDAFKICSAEQAYLAIINSDIEARLIKDLFEQYPEGVIRARNPGVISIGIVDWEHNGEWYTIHGERLEDCGYSNWGTGEPNNARKDEFCGTMFRSGYYNDDVCSSKAVFVCEKDVRNLDGSYNTTDVIYSTATDEVTGRSNVEYTSEEVTFSTTENTPDEVYYRNTDTTPEEVYYRITDDTPRKVYYRNTDTTPEEVYYGTTDDTPQEVYYRNTETTPEEVFYHTTDDTSEVINYTPTEYAIEKQTSDNIVDLLSMYDEYSS